jgi:phosphate transport system protein
MEQRAYITQRMGELKKQVLTMAAMTRKALNDALKAFLILDSDLAETVIHADVEINEMENSLDQFNLELLALTQPMAGDLRAIVGSMRMTMNMERIGDEAVNLAHRTVFLSTRPPLPLDPNMEKLAKIAQEMLADAIRAFAESDVHLAASICLRDQAADDLHYKIMRKIIADMVDESRIAERGVHHIMAAKHIERVADLCTNLAEAVIFIVKGEEIKHRCQA